MRKVKINLFLSVLFGSFLLVGSIVPAFGQNNSKIGDEIIVEHDRGNFCNGVIEAVYNYPSGNNYSVKAKCDNSAYPESVYADASMIRARPGARKPVQQGDDPNPIGKRDKHRQLINVRDDSETNTNVSTEDLDYFFGK